MPIEPLEVPQTSDPLEVLNPLISSQELSDYLGRNVTSDPAALVATQMASAVCRTMAEQVFSRLTATYGLDGTGTDVLLLPNLPVLSAGPVTVDGVAITDFTVTGNGFLLRGAAGSDPRPVWPVGRQNVVATVDHGYDTIPDDVRMVALVLAARLVVQGVASAESVGAQSITYASAATDLTDGEKAILHKYRHIR